MNNKSRMFKRVITILTILSLLVMILPMSVMAKSHSKNPNKAANEARQALRNSQENMMDEEELEDEEEKSERAEFIAARNEWAKSAGVRMPPGHANLLYKYLIASEKITETFTFGDMQGYLEGVEFFDMETREINVKELMGAIKSCKMMIAEVGSGVPDEEPSEEPAEELED